MPLKSGKSQETVGKNIKELERSYKKTGKIGTSKPKSKKAAHKQAVAIALNKAGKSKKLKESYDDIVNSYLKKYLLEMDVRQDPREGFGGDPFIDPTEDMDDEDEEVSPEEMYKAVAAAVGEQKASMMSGEEVRETYYYMQKDPSMGKDEDYEEDCESSHQGCTCDGCPQCMANKEKASGGGASPILTFYGMQ